MEYSALSEAPKDKDMHNVLGHYADSQIHHIP